MAVVFSDTFESEKTLAQDGWTITQTGGSSVVKAAVPPYVAKGRKAAALYSTGASGMAHLRKDFTATATATVGVRAYIPTYQAIAANCLIMLGTDTHLIYVNRVAGATADKLEWWNGSSVAGSANFTSDVPLDEWAWLELQLDASAATWEARFRVNGSEVCSFSPVVGAADTIKRVYIGGTDNFVVGKLYVDDVVVTDTAAAIAEPEFTNAGSPYRDPRAELTRYPRSHLRRP